MPRQLEDRAAVLYSFVVESMISLLRGIGSSNAAFRDTFKRSSHNLRKCLALGNYRFRCGGTESVRLQYLPLLADQMNDRPDFIALVISRMRTSFPLLQTIR